MKPSKRAHSKGELKSSFKTLELKLTEDAESPHTIYFKEHSVRDHTPDKPEGRTLLVLNVPPYADEKGIINAFQEAGTIQSVKFSLKPSATDEKPVRKFLHEPPKPAFRVAYIVFEKVAHLDKALKLTELQPMNSEKHTIKVGMKKWIDEYNESVLPSKILKEKVETFMKKYDQEVKKAEKKEKQLEQEDDEGWVTVTKRGKLNFGIRRLDDSPRPVRPEPNYLDPLSSASPPSRFLGGLLWF
ncbi:ribosomal RNA-processing protein 7 (RRP7) domain-containing protein [Phthorimaea operculella]|nr:ribosomal RNA-processing protein 7 (RRP7) domain-containing protein [Phthorimaea operculella]